MKKLHVLFWVSVAGAGVSLAASTNSPVRLPEVSVTSKVGADLGGQTTPASVSRFDGDEMNAAGISTFYDLPAAVPNLSLKHSVGGSFGDVYSIRGIANTEFFSDPALALYVDDAPAADVFTFPTDLLDVEQVTILRGPQGTAYGRNSEGGVIDVVTRKPTDRLEAGAGVSYSSFNTEAYRASVSGPIVPGKLRLGISGGALTSDGFVKNPLLHSHPDRQEDYNGRAYLGWTPSDGWDIGLTLTGEKLHDGVRLTPLKGKFAEVSSDINPTSDASGNGQALRIQRTLKNVIVSSITTRRDFSLDPLVMDLDLSPMPGNTALIKQDETFWSEELRLQSPADADVWEWRSGLFFSTSKRNGDDTRNFITPVAPDVYMPVEQRTVSKLTADNFAAYGQATYSGIENVGLTAGLRADYTDKGIDRTKTSTPGYPVPAVSDDKGFFNVAPKLGADLRVTTNVTAYASSGLGFKPGGFSAYIDPPKSAEFDTERNWANEIGLKSSWLENRLLANVAFFYNDIHDYQVERSIAGSTDLTIFNADKVTSKGVELELTARPVDGLELSAIGGYTDIQFDDFKSPETGADLHGKRPPYVPEFNAQLAAYYKVSCGAFARVEYVAAGKTFFDETNSAALEQKDYGLLNARIGYETRRYTVCLFGANLTDEEYYTKKLQVFEAAGVPGTPQTFGVTASVKY